MLAGFFSILPDEKLWMTDATVDGMPGFLIMGSYLRIPWYNGTRRQRNAASTQVFHHNQYETPRRERPQWGRPLALPSSVSTKDVHGMWITMWMSDQCHAVPQCLTHCPIDRQRNLCNFSKMQFGGYFDRVGCCGKLPSR